MDLRRGEYGDVCARFLACVVGQNNASNMSRDATLPQHIPLIWCLSRTSLEAERYGQHHALRSHIVNDCACARASVSTFSCCHNQVLHSITLRPGFCVHVAHCLRRSNPGCVVFGLSVSSQCPNHTKITVPVQDPIAGTHKLSPSS